MCPEGTEPVTYTGQCCPACEVVAPRTNVATTTSLIITDTVPSSTVPSTSEIAPIATTVAPIGEETTAEGLIQGVVCNRVFYLL